MRRSAGILGVLVLAGVAGCSVTYYIPSVEHSDAYIVGDTAQFVAQELSQGFETENGIDPSDKAPDLYTWSSNNSSVADFIAPGKIVTRRIGSIIVTVKSPRATYSFPLMAFPPQGAKLQAVKTIEMSVGDTVRPHADIVDSSGAIIPGVSYDAFRWLYVISELSSAVTTNVTLKDGTFALVGVRAGTQLREARLTVSKRPALADTARIIVR